MSYPSSTPSIRVFGSGSRHHGTQSDSRRLSPPHHSSSAPLPMAIPNTRENAPPPLPPPRIIEGLNHGHDAGWRWANGRNDVERIESWQPLPSVRPGSSLLGGASQRPTLPRAHSEQQLGTDGLRQRPNDISMPPRLDTDMREGVSRNHGEDDRRSLPSLTRLRSETQLGRQEVHNSAQAYDKQLLSRIGGPDASRSNMPALLSPTHESPLSRRKVPAKLTGQLKPLSMPTPSFDGQPSRWPRTPLSAQSSASLSIRSPLFDSHSIDSAFSPQRRTSNNTDYKDSLRTFIKGDVKSEEQEVLSEPDMEENGMRDLNLSDRSPSAGDEQQNGSNNLKRRASSPLSDGQTRDDRLPGNGNDLYHRRSIHNMLATKNSPSAKLNPIYGSTSSASSLAPGSYGSSNWNMSLASSATSFGERLSPSAISPSMKSDYGPGSPYGISRGMKSEYGPSSPYGINRGTNRSEQAPSAVGHHQQNSDHEYLQTVRSPTDHEQMQVVRSPTDMGSELYQNSSSRIQGVYMCDCCLKKPRKFSTADELRAHQLEKQYQCMYCPNRFKNKNEMERHQNSLHLRSHSWSCSALQTAHAVFHLSTVHPSSTDVCGYCGVEFPNPADWDARNEHVAHVHKFGECNQHKKFFRADHFRQHLKHSHGGASGKWTNTLENACMRNEPPPIPLKDQQRLAQGVGSPLGGSGAMAVILNDVQGEQ